MQNWLPARNPRHEGDFEPGRCCLSPFVRAQRRPERLKVGYVDPRRVSGLISRGYSRAHHARGGKQTRD